MAKRNRVISIARGVCIILMVVGHSGCPDYLMKLIFLFHMPFFFFASGYFCRTEHTLRGDENSIGLYRRIFRRFKRLYLPFILYGLAFLLLHNLFLSLGLYSPDLDGAAYDLPAFTAVALKMFLKMDLPSRLMGGCWFLRSLLIAAVSIDIALYVLRKYQKAPLLLTILAAAIVLVLRIAPDGTPVIRQLIPAAMGGYFFLLGMHYRKWEDKVRPGVLLVVVMMALLAVCAALQPMEMGTPGVLNSLSYMIVAPAGILLVMLLSKVLDKTPVNNLLGFLGDNSLTILALHFLCFKLVSLLAIKTLGLPSEMLAEFPVIPGLGGAWWVLYSIAGLLIPGLISLLAPRKI
jgi:fucose 4-O-acetylase-like acetyltransferase